MTPPADPDILGKIILLQSTLHVMKDDMAMSRFVCRGLSGIPGFDAVGMFIRGNFFAGHSGYLAVTDEDCQRLFRQLSDNTRTQSECERFLSKFRQKHGVHCLRIETSFNLYGLLLVRTTQEDYFAEIRPYIENVLNIIALTIENSLQQELLLQNKKDLETLVAQRTQELESSIHSLQIEVAERKQAEADREKLQAQLLQAQKMESVGRLAGGVAHDFNNKLQTILGFTEMALDDAEPESPVLTSLVEIRNAARGAADLTRQLLAFARKQTISPRLLNINTTVAGMLKMLSRLIGENIDLVWKPGAGVWQIRMDPVQIDQILANLTINARDAITGVGNLTIETDNVVFDAEYCAQHPEFVPGHYVMLAVSDTGCGMRREVLEKIFEPFFTTKSLGKGTGLGLATVYGIVRQNDGFINVYSEPGSGTTFRIYLPGLQAPAVDTTKDTACSQPLRGVETILMAEDDDAILNLGAAMLRKYGYTVLTARTPDTALTLATHHTGPIHLLITDVVMPGMNGKDLREKLCALRPDIRCIFMSGYTANVIAHHGILEENIHFLQKPFSMKTIVGKVREVLDSSAM